MTEEGVARHLAEGFRGGFRGPEDDPDFLAQLNQANRPEPPSEG